jgi:membrane protein YdbS with pleckstrin-like domain
MIQLQTITKLPNEVYRLAFIKLLLLLCGFSLLCGISFGSTSVFLGVLIFCGLFIGLPVWIIVVLAFKNISFKVDENSLTINSGILSKHSDSIVFSQINNVDCIGGPLMSQFRLAQIEVWTSSPAQIEINDGRSKSFPSGSLILAKDDAEWLKKLIISKQTTVG